MIRQGSLDAGGSPRIIDLVFGTAPRAPRRRRVPPALALAILVHLALVVWALGSRPSLELWSAEIAARVHAELTHVEMVEIDPPPTPAPSPPVDTPPPEPPAALEIEPSAEPERAAIEPPRSAPSRSRASMSPSPEPPPAAAGTVITADDGAVDLTDAIPSGQGSAYAGGVTSSAGNGTGPGGRGAGTSSKPARAPTPAPPRERDDDRAAPVEMASDQWICPWPRQAVDAADNEEFVILKVLVDRRGAVLDARLIADPGRGFGDAALACARATRFTAARDRQGAAIQAWSPPIRVRFYR